MLLKVAFVLALCMGCHSKMDLSRYFRTCARGPELAQCLAAAAQQGLGLLAAGAPELDLPPLDPYLHRELPLEYNNNQINAKVLLTNVKIAGLKEAKIKTVRAKVEEEQFRLEVEAVQGGLDVEGGFRAEGRFNTMLLDTKGFFNVTIRKIKYTWQFDGRTEMIDGVKFCRITSFQTRPDIGDMRLHATNLFPDNPELAEMANNMANENWRVLYRELYPYAQQHWSHIPVNLANKIFLAVPYDELFPKR